MLNVKFNTKYSNNIITLCEINSQVCQKFNTKILTRISFNTSTKNFLLYKRT